MSVYYVDQTSGNDSSADPTNINTPWKTIAKVNSSTFSGDDQILFKKGEVWRETLTVPSSGTAGHPITFGAYGTGASPVISGSDLITAGWSAYSPPSNEDFTDGTGAKPISWWMFEDASSPAVDGNTDNANNLTWGTSAARDSSHIQGSYSLLSGTSTTNRAYANLTNMPGKAATTDITAGFWGEFVATIPNSTDVMRMVDNSYTSGWYFLSGSSGSEKMRFRCYSTGTGWVGADTNAAIGTGWHHIVGRWNGSGDDEISIWVDGVKQTATATMATMTLAASGAFTCPHSNAVCTRFDEAFVFAAALTDDQIQSIYTHGLAGER